MTVSPISMVRPCRGKPLGELNAGNIGINCIQITVFQGLTIAHLYSLLQQASPANQSTGRRRTVIREAEYPRPQ